MRPAALGFYSFSASQKNKGWGEKHFSFSQRATFYTIYISVYTLTQRQNFQIHTVVMAKWMKLERTNERRVK